MRKSRGPRIDPCGTPLDTLAGWENLWLVNSNSVTQVSN